MTVETWLADLKQRHASGSLTEGAYYAGVIGVVQGAARSQLLDLAVSYLNLVPNEFLRDIPNHETPVLKAAVIEIAEIFRAAGIADPILVAPGNRPS